MCCYRHSIPFMSTLLLCGCFSVPEQKNPLLLLKQSAVGTGMGRVKRRYKRKNAGSPAKKGPSPVKRRQTASSPAKALPLAVKSRELTAISKVSRRRVEDTTANVCFVQRDSTSLPPLIFPRWKTVLLRPPQNKKQRFWPHSPLGLLQRWREPMTWRTSEPF